MLVSFCRSFSSSCFTRPETFQGALFFSDCVPHTDVCVCCCCLFAFIICYISLIVVFMYVLYLTPVSANKPVGETETCEDQPAEHQLRGRRALSAAGSQGRRLASGMMSAEVGRLFRAQSLSAKVSGGACSCCDSHRSSLKRVSSGDPPFRKPPIGIREDPEDVASLIEVP